MDMKKFSARLILLCVPSWVVHTKIVLFWSANFITSSFMVKKEHLVKIAFYDLTLFIYVFVSLRIGIAISDSVRPCVRPSACMHAHVCAREKGFVLKLALLSLLSK